MHVKRRQAIKDFDQEWDRILDTVEDFLTRVEKWDGGSSFIPPIKMSEIFWRQLTPHPRTTGLVMSVEVKEFTTGGVRRFEED